ncbi:MAG TPA: hypothetical protein VMP11_12550 [Verrucomicrobiae bacterium]|nr:hypothetical protein [Verrucomicrobiae bacterium]
MKATSHDIAINKVCFAVAGRLGRALVVVFALGVASSEAQTYSFVPFPNNATHTAAVVAAAIANVPTNVGVVLDANGQTNDIQIWNYDTGVYTGAVDITSTLQRIRNGQSVANTESDDGGFFNFYSYEFPNIPRKGNNYYMEFVVWPYLNLTSGTYYTGTDAYGSMAYPGAMRMLLGRGGEVYFTGDHYGEDGPQQNAYYLVPSPDQAMGNSWINAVGAKWEIAANWNFSAGAPSAAPSNCDPADLITNAGNKTITLDAVTAAYKTNLSVLSINNLLLSAPSGSVNSLALSGGFTNVLRIASGLSIFSGGSLTVAGGSITVNDELQIDGGALLANGAIHAYSNLVVGDCGNSVSGSLSVSGGALYVTNSTQTGVLNVPDGIFALSGGLVQANTVVITNTCAQFLHTGGTIVVGNLILDPNLFRITSVVRQTDDLVVTWMMGPGATNALQATTGDANGNYITNGFTDIFIVTNNPTPGTVTNYVDRGAATNGLSRYYRTRLGL